MRPLPLVKEEPSASQGSAKAPKKLVRRIVASDDEDEGGESSPVAVAPPVAGGLTKKKKVSAVEVDEKEEGTPPPKKAKVEPSSSSRWAALKRPKRESRAVKLGVVDVAEEEVIGRMGALVEALDEEGGLPVGCRFEGVDRAGPIGGEVVWFVSGGGAFIVVSSSCNFEVF